MTPSFEFKCNKCDEHFETNVGWYDKVRCPECQSKKTERIKVFFPKTKYNYRGLSHDIPSGKGPKGRGAKDISEIK